LFIKIGAVVASAAVAAFGLVGPGQADNTYKNKYPEASDSRVCGENTVDYLGPLKLWPPNHKLQDVTLSSTDSSGDETTLTIMVGLQETLGGEGQGSGAGGPAHDPDVFYPNGPTAAGAPTATVPVQLRAERSGRGDGRTYVIDWTATFDNGMSMCSSADEGQEPFTVFVPHDMRGGADWK
jgi:hypothetical protein